MIIELNRAFSHIQYVDEGHYYINSKTGNNLVSATTYKKEFQDPFKNYDYHLKKKAKINGLSVAEMKDEWDCKRETGTTRGQLVHDWAEAVSNRKHFNLPLQHQGMASLKRQVLHYFRDNSSYTNIATEFVLGNDKIGGQIDRLVVDEKDKLGICDYKTDSKSEEELTKSYGKKLKKHLHQYEDCILNGYFIQVNLYRELLESAGFTPEFMLIVHFNSNNPTYRVYTVPVIHILNA